MGVYGQKLALMKYPPGSEIGICRWLLDLIRAKFDKYGSNMKAAADRGKNSDDAQRLDH